MPTTSTNAAEQPEPTLRDVLVAVNGLGDRMDHVETEMTALIQFSRHQFSRLTTEIAGVKDTVGRLDRKMTVIENRVTSIENRVTLIDAQLTDVRHDVRLMVPQVEEAVRLGRNNRDMLSGIKADIAHLDEKIDHHWHDNEIHVPRPRDSDAPDVPATA